MSMKCVYIDCNPCWHFKIYIEYTDENHTNICPHEHVHKCKQRNTLYTSIYSRTHICLIFWGKLCL
uniref:Uncharacterized protein n=1 Tax=Octopus bimaculoides TaxID=37653 RepID=A0A0L8G303_OCTBM